MWIVAFGLKEISMGYYLYLADNKALCKLSLNK